jgi:hypothetical protein
MSKKSTQIQRTKRDGKARLTVSLSQDVAAYLEAERTRAQAPSMSAYFETIVRNLQAQAEIAEMEAKMVACSAEMAEQADWGRVGAASLARLED